MARLARDSPDSHWGLRLAAGAFAGLAGGLVFGVLMSVPAVFTQPLFAGTGVFTLLGTLLGLDGGSWFHLLYVWGIHVVASILFGLVFALVVPPSARARTTLALGLAWGIVLWGASLALAALVLGGPALVLDASTGLNLVGHVLFGATLGLVYPMFDREEEELRRGRGEFRPVPPVE